MRALLKPEITEKEIVKARATGLIPSRLPVNTDPKTGRLYFEYQFRVSTDIDWSKVGPYVESLINLVKNYCDFYKEGLYEDEKLAPGIKVIVRTQRNVTSGISWQEIEIYGNCVPDDKAKGVTPDDIMYAHHLFRTKRLKIAVEWSSGLPFNG